MEIVGARVRTAISVRHHDGTSINRGAATKDHQARAKVFYAVGSSDPLELLIPKVSPGTLVLL